MINLTNSFAPRLNMLSAVFTDLIQRILTCNKREQCASLYKLFHEINYKPDAKILDFGCGTGIFAKLFNQKELNLRYFGYDVDKCLTEYGQCFHHSSRFMYQKQDVTDNGPYDYILSNCCFHHISDDQLVDELEFIRKIIKKEGYFIVVDILAQDEEETPLHRLYMMIEQGKYIRSRDDYIQLLKDRYDIMHMKAEKSHFLSIHSIPIYNNLGIFVCQPNHSVNVSKVKGIHE